MNRLVKTSYAKDDVIVLLKDLTGGMKPLSTEEREKAIQGGVHYSALLPEEKEPTPEYMELYYKALNEKKESIAQHIGKIAEILYSTRIGQQPPIIVSLARAGIPVGILIKRYIKEKYDVSCPHYAISIIRDKGIDVNAMEYIYDTEMRKNNNYVSSIRFVDGWIGKGAIKSQLDESVEQLKSISTRWAKLSSDLYVLADCAYVTDCTGTREDYLLPTACLNSTVSGLTSRTILNDYIDVLSGDFHGAVYFKCFEKIDKSVEFINTISSEFKNIEIPSAERFPCDGEHGIQVVHRVCRDFSIEDYKKVKPGIGETTRVLLRRVPWMVLLNTNVEETDPDIAHILLLCKQKDIPIKRYELGEYKVCGIIKELSADA